MEFLKTIKRRSFLHEAIYVTLNICLAIALALIVHTTGSLWLAFALVLISKWRIFAVRPRFWLAHIQADFVSMIVSLGYVVFLYVLNLTVMSDFQIIISQAILALLYIGWLLFLKSQSKRFYVVAQAGIALFIGVTAIYAVAYNWIAAPVVLLMWLVGYATAKHVLGSYNEESHTVLLSLSWGMILAEIGWLAYHWTIAYALPFTKGVLLPQVSIIILCLSFVVFKSYDSFYHHQKIRLNDIILPLLFSICIICVLVLGFNNFNIASV